MGKLLAKELGYDYYDREILRIASDESGISEELFTRADENTRLPLFRIARHRTTGVKTYDNRTRLKPLCCILA